MAWHEPRRCCRLFAVDIRPSSLPLFSRSGPFMFPYSRAIVLDEPETPKRRALSVFLCRSFYLFMTSFIGLALPFSFPIGQYVFFEQLALILETETCQSCPDYFASRPGFFPLIFCGGGLPPACGGSGNSPHDWEGPVALFPSLQRRFLLPFASPPDSVPPPAP